MTETDLAVTIQATALAALLESAHTPHELAVYRGALTPRELDAPETEIAALARSRTPRPGLDAARGGARRRPLSLAERDGHQHGERPVSEHRGMEPGVERAGADSGRPDGVAGRRGAFTAAAKACGCHRQAEGDPLLGTPFAGESGLELEIAADQYEKLMAHLNHFIIMDDVELVPLGEEQVARRVRRRPWASPVRWPTRCWAAGPARVCAPDEGSSRGVERAGFEDSARVWRAGAAL